ncbi:ribonuclease I precursor [bacterium BMS3Bbin10]|nr:ribonuclease I precursor [bacterium BMS3Bbin10]
MTEGLSPPWRLGLAALAISLASPAEAQAARDAETPGEFDYYVLALSWSPSFCAGRTRAKKSPQCAGTRPYAFVLHGLWPQYEKGWPDYCDTGVKPWVPRRLINSMLDIMPARNLVIHQYKKHGTCSGLGPEGYFEAARKAFKAITIPARYLSPRKPVLVSPREIENDFLKTNQSLAPEMISIACGRGKRLREVRICFTKDLEPRACGVNEAQAKLCRLNRVVMPPVRGR